MRVLMIAATYPPTRCGVGDYARRLGRELAHQGATVRVLTGTSTDEEHDHATGDEHTSAGARPPRVRRTPVDFADQGDGIALARAVEEWDWTALDFVEDVLDAGGIDVVSLQYHGEDYLLHPAICAVADLARARGVAVVTTLHNLQQPRPWAHGDDPLGHLLTHSAAWITTNTLDERRLRGITDAHARLHLVAAGPAITAPSDPVHPRADDLFHVAYFGFLNPFKGIEYLLRAIARLRDADVPLRATVAAGIHSDAPGRLRRYAESIDHECTRLQLDGILERRGYISDTEVSELLQSCHLAVFPFREGLSGKNSSFWSTMHHATPTLTTRGPGLPPGLVDGENTLLVDPDDDEALAARIRWAMDHRDDLAGIGRAGRAFVLHDFDWGALARRTLAVFDQARGARVSGGGRS